MKYTLIRSKRKTISIEVNKDLEIIVRAPLRCSTRTIDSFVISRQDWINKAIDRMAKRNVTAQATPKLSDNDIKKLKAKARQAIPAKVAYYAPIVGVSYGQIAIRNQATRWGSCSSKGNLNFNCKLMLLDDKLIDYVVVHELCHRLHMNHSPLFWAEVERILPDYRERRKALKALGPIS